MASVRLSGALIKLLLPPISKHFETGQIEPISGRRPQPTRVRGAPQFPQVLSRAAVQDWVLSFEIPGPMSAVTATCR
jgi:hypothetical protein